MIERIGMSFMKQIWIF